MNETRRPLYIPPQRIGEIPKGTHLAILDLQECRADSVKVQENTTTEITFEPTDSGSGQIANCSNVAISHTNLNRFIFFALPSIALGFEKEYYGDDEEDGEDNEWRDGTPEVRAFLFSLIEQNAQAPLIYPTGELHIGQKYLSIEYDHADFCGEPDGWSASIDTVLSKSNYDEERCDRDIRSACDYWKVRSSFHASPVDPDWEVQSHSALDEDGSNFYRNCGMGGDWPGYYYAIPQNNNQIPEEKQPWK